MGGKERLESKPCNQFVCQRQVGKATLTCESMVDVILVIDGSGSLGSRGWTASVKAAAMLARGFGGSKKLVKLAVLLFSWKSEWVTHFTDDTEGAAKKIEGLNWPRSATFTANALNAAKSELSLGRADAQSVVIVITDGRPMSMRQTWISSWYLRQKARLMWVPVTRWAPVSTMKTWASHPVSENFLALQDFSDLTNPDKLDLIISDVCPELSR
jgi:Mg-chelatase subunit ChlD